MPNKPFDNFVLSTYAEDQFNSHLNLAQFCRIDTSLEETAGMKKIIHVYSATDGTEKLKMGEGNTKRIEATFTEREYEVVLAQNKFEYYDEEEMRDPFLIQTGMRHAGTDLFNTTQADVYAEFSKATQKIEVATFDFGAFVDAAALLKLENLEGVQKFLFVNPKDMAEIRKNLKDDLKYVSEFANTGYVGTVGDWNLYTKKDAIEGTIVGGVMDSVTLFIKKGVDVEPTVGHNRSSEDADVRLNSVFSRKYYLAALTDETKAVMITKASAVGNSEPYSEPVIKDEVA